MSNWKRFTNSMAKLHFASDGTGSIPQLKEMIINLQNVALPFKDEQIINLQVKHGRVQHWIFHSFTYSFKRNMSSAFKNANLTKVTEPNSNCRKKINWHAYMKSSSSLMQGERKKDFQIYPFTVVNLPIVYIPAHQFAYHKCFAYRKNKECYAIIDVEFCKI